MTVTTADLQRFSNGTEKWHHIILNFYVTDGVKFLMDNAGAFWLATDIAAYQAHPAVKRLPYQVWTLTVPDRKEGDTKMVPGLLTCVPDIGERPVYRQDLTATDFPLPEVKLWVEEG